MRLAAGLLALALAGTSPAEELVSRYNARNFGSPGWRRIHLELKNRGRVSRSFTMLHLFQQQSQEIRSLVLLEGPSGLVGTDYLLVEGEQLAGGMSLYLHLPAGKRQTLNIKPSRFDEGLLGSDFSYSDLRWQIPIQGNQLRSLGAATILDRPAQQIELVPDSPESREIWSWKRIVYSIASDGSCLLGADFYGASPAEPVKRLRVLGLERRGAVWTPTRMEMTLAGGRSSVLTLKDAGFGTGRFKADLFAPENLPDLGDQVLAGKGRELIEGGKR